MRVTARALMHGAGHIAGTMLIGMALIMILPQGFLGDVNQINDFIAVVGWPFLTMYSLLTLALLWSLMRIHQARRNEATTICEYWAHIGIQICGLLSTMALVFTLWGLSQGVLILGVQQVTADSIDQLLSQLMTHFGVAFYSSIIGLPTAALGRLLVFVVSSKTWKKESAHAVSI